MGPDRRDREKRAPRRTPWRGHNPGRSGPKGAACRATAGAVADGCGLRAPQAVRWLAAKRPRVHTRSKGRCCTCRTSPFLRSSTRGSAGKFEAAELAYLTSWWQAKSDPLSCWPGLSAASGVSCRVRAERRPYSVESRFTPRCGWFPRSLVGFGRNLLGSPPSEGTPARISCDAMYML
jgi:hypothetical protein